MSRFFTWATVPTLLVCLLFDTAYIDICLLTIVIMPLVRITLKKSVSPSVVTVIFSIIAFCLCQECYSITDKSFYPLIGKPITLECVVTGSPSYSGENATYPVKMLSANVKGKVYPLSDNAIVYCDCASRESVARYGDRLEFKTILTLPEDNALASRRRHFLGQGISVICSTEDFAVTNHGTADGVSPISLGIYRLREFLIRKCDRYFSPDTAEFVKAIMLGEKSNMPDDIKSNITRSGISHVTSVSGLHLSLIVSISTAFLGAFGIKRTKHRRRIMATIGIVCGILASILTGLTPSVKRAMLMLIAANSATLIGRDRDSADSLAFALLVLLTATPFAMYDVRLSLSATAVLGIVLLSPFIKSVLCRFMKEGYLTNLISMTISAQVFSTPVMALYFGTFSAVSLFTNIIVVPLMYPLMLLGLIFLMSPFGIVSGFISGGMWIIIRVIFKVSELAASLPFAQMEAGIATYLKFLAVLISVIGGVYLIISSKSNLGRFAVIGITGTIISTTLAFPFSKSLTIDFINPGQGECSLARIDHRINLMIDCGTYHDSEYSSHIIKQYLTSESIYKIDYLILSSVTEGAVYNFSSLADKVKITSVIIPDYISVGNYINRNLLLKTAEEKNIEVYAMGKGDTFALNERAHIKVLSPDSEISGCKGNMVFDLSYDGKRILFLGNADSYDNQLLIEGIGDCDFDIMKLSGKSRHLHTDEKLIGAISPDKVFAFRKSFNDKSYERIKNFLYNKNTDFYPIGSAPPHLTISGGEIEIKEGEEIEEYKGSD